MEQIKMVASSLDVLTVVLVSLSIIAFNFLLKSQTQRNKLPPSPMSLPIIGHYYVLKPKVPLQRTLESIAKKLGPIIYIRFGKRNVIFLSSPSLVEECLTKNDVVLANRPTTVITKFLGQELTTIITSPYSDHYVNLRRICNVQVFSNHRMSLSSDLRRGYMESWLREIHRTSSNNVVDGGFGKVVVRSFCFKIAFQMLMLLVIGETSTQEEETEFKLCLKEVGKRTTIPFPGYFFPLMKFIRFKWYTKKVKKTASRVDRFVEGLIEKRRVLRGKGKDPSNVIDQLLALQESDPQYYNDNFIMGVVADLLLAGTHTVDSTIEWTMSNLLNEPEIMTKAKTELDVEIGQDRLIADSDISKLPYLKSIISETLRLYPANPILIPHKSSAECTIGGYTIPKDTMIVFNAWAIHRDPKLWDDASSFKPERFLNKTSQVDDFKFIPFGYGRRSCPGSGVANRFLILVVGAMIQCFDWKKLGDDKIDMTEEAMLSLPKAKGLAGLCKARGIMDKLNLLS